MTSSPGRVLVTGAAGFIGSHLCEQLLNAYPQAQLVGLDAFTPFYDVNVKRGNLAGPLASGRFALVEGDVCDAATWKLVRERGPYSHVVHLAAEAGVRESIRRPADYYRVNVQGSALLLDQLARDGAGPALVVASSSSVYGASLRVPYQEDDPADTPVSPYAASKRAMELACQAWTRSVGGPSITALRFFTVYGPRQRPDMAITGFARKLLRGEAITLFNPDRSRRDYTYVSDVVDGIIAAMGRRGGGYRVYNIASGQSVPLRQMVDALQDALGVRGQVIDGPAAQGDMEQTWGDVSRARAELQWEPRVQLVEGLRRSAGYLRGLA